MCSTSLMVPVLKFAGMVSALAMDEFEHGSGRAQAHQLQKFTTVRQLAIICHKISLARIEIQALNSTKWWRRAATRLHRQPRARIVKSK